MRTHSQPLRRACALIALLLLSPACGCAPKMAATIAAPPPAATVAVAAPTPTPTPEPTPEPTPAPTPFAFLWMTDTQSMPGRPGLYATLGAWAAEQIEPRNIRCLLHTGDIVDAFPSRSQWAEAESCFSQLRGKLPMLFIAGNHDMNGRRLSYERFREGVYGSAENAAALDNSFNNGQGRYLLLTEGGIDFLFLGMSYLYQEEELVWMDEVLAAYPDRVAVLLLHEYMRGDGELLEKAERLCERLVQKHANVRLILCGHHHGNAIRTDRFDDDGDGADDRFVQTLMYNYQDSTHWRGCVQILTIDPATSEMDVFVYTPLTDRTDTEHCTSIPLDLSGFSR